MEKCGKRVPKCGRCRNHGVDSVLKGHKTTCRWKDCLCDLCSLICLRKQLSGKLISIKRKERTKEEDSKSHDEYTNTPSNNTADQPSGKRHRGEFSSAEDHHLSNGGRFFPPAVGAPSGGLPPRNDFCGACCFGDPQAACNQFCSPMWQMTKDPVFLPSGPTDHEMNNCIGTITDNVGYEPRPNEPSRIQSSLDLLSYVADTQSPQPVNNNGTNQGKAGQPRNQQQESVPNHQISRTHPPQLQVQADMIGYSSSLDVPESAETNRLPDSFRGLHSESQLPPFRSNGFPTPISQQATVTSMYNPYYSKVESLNAVECSPALQQDDDTWYRHMFNINNVPMSEWQQCSSLPSSRLGPSVNSTETQSFPVATEIQQSERVMKDESMVVWRPYDNTITE